jgi:lipoate-protein ligase A
MNSNNNFNELPPATWRLIKSKPAPGSWNMAVDEAVLESTRDGKVLPTLRLFAWAPACITLGYAQEVSDVDLDRLTARGWEIVRRITGGRSILHTDELTYSVAGPEGEPRLAGDILASYQRLSSAILAALESLGLAVQAKPKEEVSKAPMTEPVCFEIPSNYEITINGKKLVGSAQARKKDGVLQHGTLPLYGDLTRITDVLAFEDEERRAKAAERLLARASTVESTLGYPISWEQAAEAFITGFSRTLNLTFEPGELTPEELDRAKELEEIKYKNLEWIENR